VPVDRNSLPKDPEILQQMLVDLTSQLDKTQRLLAQLLVAKSDTRRKLSAELSNAATELRPIPHRTTIFRLGLAPAVAMRIKAARADGVHCPRI
jgi:hypothetical protein